MSPPGRSASPRPWRWAGGCFGLPFGWALLGAALFTISNNLFIRGSHVQLFSVSFVPALALLAHGALAALWEGRRGALLGWGAGFCVLFAACLMTGFYMAWYSAFLGGGAAAGLAGGGRRRGAAAAVGDGAGAGLAAGRAARPWRCC